MDTTEKSPFSAQHIAEFNRVQALRPVLFRKITDAFEIYRHCPNRTCKRARACRDARGACFLAVLDAMPDETRRLFAHAARNRADGLGPDESLSRARARIDADEARLSEWPRVAAEARVTPDARRAGGGAPSGDSRPGRTDGPGPGRSSLFSSDIPSV